MRIESIKGIDACIDLCYDGHRICAATSRYCITQGGDHVESTRLALLLSCSEMCRNIADVMLARTGGQEHLYLACAQLCRECAKSCEAMNDPTMKTCAEACRRCADCCEKMVGYQ